MVTSEFSDLIELCEVTMKFALIGGKLQHSYSAIIHKMFFDLTGIKGTYELVEVPSADNLKEKIKFFEQNVFTGINVTIPYKKEILKYADILSDEVVKLGAANTVHFHKDKRIIYNTDYFGFKRTLELNKVNPSGQKWLVLGYGGGAKSVIAVLNDMGADKVTIASTSQRGENYIIYSEIEELEGYFGVVNTTPVGMYPDINSSPINIEDVKKFKTAVDIVYNPLDTKFLKTSALSGLKTVSGLYMLVAQAIKSQEIWNNCEFPDDIIDRIYKKVGGML